MKILVVDDDPEIADLVKTVLSDGGHDVADVASGSAALQASIMHEYDLLICDLMLPDLEGTEIVRALKAQAPHLPVVDYPILTDPPGLVLQPATDGCPPR